MPDTPGTDASARLVELISEWRDGLPEDAGPDDGELDVSIVVTTRASGDAINLDLTPRGVTALKRALMIDIGRNKAAQEQAARNEKMAAVLVAASIAGEDIGELLACALSRAARSLFRPWYLVAGRPGSWEASIVMGLVSEGEWLTPVDPARAEELTTLLVSMGEQREDGGDTISWVLGKAVDQRGGMRAFLGTSSRQNVLANIGGQYATVADRGPWE